MIQNLTDFTIVKRHFALVDPVLSAVLATVQLSDWFEDRSSSDHFVNLARNIVYQQLAGKAASTIFSRFAELIGGTITPDAVLSTPDQALRNVGLSWAKVKYVKDLAAKTASKEIVFDKIDTLDNESVITLLTHVKGIGQWTAEMYLLFTLHRENIFSYGDLGLKNGFSQLYGVTNPTPSQIQAVVSRWAPYESYGSISLWHYLDNT